jgi:hypothetical protein
LFIVLMPLWITFFILGLLILVTLVLPYVIVAEGIRDRRAIRNVGARLVFSYSPRHGWNEFVVNNVLPVLDAADWIVLQTRRLHADPVNRLQRLLPAPPGWKFGMASFVPAIVLFRRGRVRRLTIPMRERLRPLKSCGKKSRDTQAAVECVIVDTLREHGIELRKPRAA